MTEPYSSTSHDNGTHSEGEFRCPNCGIVLHGIADLRTDLTLDEFQALRVELGKGPHCLHARLRDMLIHFPLVALDCFPYDYREDFFFKDEL